MVSWMDTKGLDLLLVGWIGLDLWLVGRTDRSSSVVGWMERS